MSQILVLVDHHDGAVRKSTTELLTIARRLGDPVAVVIGHGADKATETLAAYGATSVVSVDAPDIDDYLILPRVEAMQAAAEQVQPSVILLTSNAKTKEIAAHLAVRLESGIITDAIDVQAGPDGPVTTQSVFAGSYTVQAQAAHEPFHGAARDLEALSFHLAPNLAHTIDLEVILPDALNFGFQMPVTR